MCLELESYSCVYMHYSGNAKKDVTDSMNNYINMFSVLSVYMMDDRGSISDRATKSTAPWILRVKQLEWEVDY